MDPRHNPKYFSLVYEAARVENHGELVKLLTQQVPLDCKDHFGLFTPAGQLAGEGRDKAVELLLKLGASNDYVAMAYAAQGRVEEAEKLRKKGGISIKCLAIGAAMFHNNDYAEYLRKKFKLTPEWFVFGAALGKQNHYANELVALADKDKTDEDDENYLTIELRRIQGLLLSGQLTVAHLIYAKHASSVVKQRMSMLICIRQEDISYALIQGKCIMDEKRGVSTLFQNPDLRLRDTEKHSAPADIVQWMGKNEQFYSSDLLVYELTAITNERFLNQLCEAANVMVNNAHNSVIPFELMGPGYYYHECFENFSAHRLRAGKLQTLMKKYQFNYDQAEAFLAFSAIRNLLYLSAFRGPRACNMLCVVICQVTGLGEEDAIGMMEQYMLFHAKAQVTCILDKLYNKHYSIWYPFNNSAQKLDRVQSLSAASAQVTTFDALIDLPRIQFGLFSKTLVLEVNPLLPKHMQPLSNNDTTCELAQVVTDMLKCARLNKANLPRKLT